MMFKFFVYLYNTQKNETHNEKYTNYGSFYGIYLYGVPAQSSRFEREK